MDTIHSVINQDAGSGDPAYSGIFDVVHKVQVCTAGAERTVIRLARAELAPESFSDNAKEAANDCGVEQPN